MVNLESLQWITSGLRLNMPKFGLDVLRLSSPCIPDVWQRLVSQTFNSNEQHHVRQSGPSVPLGLC